MLRALTVFLIVSRALHCRRKVASICADQRVSYEITADSSAAADDSSEWQ